MRKIAAGLFISLDGVVESPEKWTGPYFNDQVGQAVGALMASNDAMLLGRTTYEGFAAAFGGQSGGMADQMNNTPKFVVSSTLAAADWQTSTLARLPRPGRPPVLPSRPLTSVPASLVVGSGPARADPGDGAAVLQVDQPLAAGGRPHPPPDRTPEQVHRVRERGEPGLGDLLGLQH